MELTLIRYGNGGNSTGGLLFVNGSFFCFTLEDQYQPVKILKETRIPAGRYEIKFRNAGGLNERYSERYSFHNRGMLHLQDVPDFTWIYIHIGNTDDQTEGCILIGNGATTHNGEFSVQKSVVAYERLYKLAVYASVHLGEPIHITIKDKMMGV